MAIFNERMKKIRIKKNMSQREIAEKIGWHKQVWQAYESGEREPSIGKAVKIADVLGVSLDWLAGLSDKEDMAI